MADVGWGEIIGASVAVFGVVTAIVKAMVGPHVETLKDHGTRIADIEKNGATSEALKDVETTIVRVIREGNSDIITRIGAVDRKADEAHARLNRQQEQELDRLRADARGHVV